MLYKNLLGNIWRKNLSKKRQKIQNLTWKPQGRNLMHRYKVKDIMTKNVFVLYANETLDIVRSLMEIKHVRHVPIVDTKREICRADNASRSIVYDGFTFSGY